MSNWILIVSCGLITFLTRFLMIVFLKKEMFNKRIREILSYVPAAIFPAIIFPAIFLDNAGSFQIEDNPTIGVLSKNIIATIFFGLASYWTIIFI